MQAVNGWSRPWTCLRNSCRPTGNDHFSRPLKARRHMSTRP
jgi:hypothetical protein